MTLELNTKLEKTVNRPAIPATRKPTNTFQSATVMISHSESLSMISEMHSLAVDQQICGNDEFGRMWHK
jgi:hypothetical protein